MKVTYTIRVLPSVAVPVPPGTLGLTIATATVSWEVTEGGYLEAVVIAFSGAEMRYNEKGSILPTYPELEEDAYRVANFVADRIFVQTAFYAIDPSDVLSQAPVIAPENPNEQNELTTKYRSVWISIKSGWITHGLFEPAVYGSGFKHSVAHGYFADAVRSACDFQRFELLYKVIEYFFVQDGAALDTAVSAHVTPHDVRYTAAALKQLRLLRNRSIHPRARQGHVSPRNTVHVREVHTALPRMRQLSSLLLDHPTF